MLEMSLLQSNQESTEGRRDHSISVGVSEILTLSFIQLHPEKDTGDLYKLPFLKPRILSSLHTCSQNEWTIPTREYHFFEEARVNPLNPHKLNFQSFTQQVFVETLECA